MADFWKSNPRKFCEVCKCWFADDKASRDFHEGGRRHQANVKKQLETARTRASQNNKEKASLEKTLRSIEHAAFNSYQQDMAGVAKKANPRGASEEQMSQIEQFLAAEQDTLEREIEKEKIRTMAEEKVKELQAKAAVEAAQKAYFETMAEWQQCYSPEGYLYYYNTKTGASQWEMPGNSEAAGSGPVTSEASTAPPEASTVPPSSTAEPSSAQGSSATENLKRTAETAGMQDPPEHPQPKRRGRAYGGTWTTVTMYDQEEAKPRESGDGKDDESEEQSKEEDIQFEEKTLSGGSLQADEGKLGRDFKGFSFKKRTNKRVAKIRGRTND